MGNVTINYAFQCPIFGGKPIFDEQHTEEMLMFPDSKGISYNKLDWCKPLYLRQLSLRKQQKISKT